MGRGRGSPIGHPRGHWGARGAVAIWGKGPGSLGGPFAHTLPKGALPGRGWSILGDRMVDVAKWQEQFLEVRGRPAVVTLFLAAEEPA